MTLRLFALALLQLLASLPVHGRTLPYEYGPHLKRAVRSRSYTILPRQVCGTMIVNPATNMEILQGLATDGGGVGYDAPAVVWILIALALGLPLAAAGVRGARLTSGAGLGLVLVVGTWAAFVNSMSASGVPDIAILLTTFIVFIIGFVIGIVTIDYGMGVVFLGVVGGLSFGIRLVLLRDGLLIPIYFLNWVFIALFGLAGGFTVVYRERIGVIVGSTTSGTFLFFLGIDLAANTQNGMSRGLRFLFDRNTAHFVDILSNGYKPPSSTKILIGLSLILIPALSFAQDRVFRRPFWIRGQQGARDWLNYRRTTSVDSQPVINIGPPLMNIQNNAQPETSRFSL